MRARSAVELLPCLRLCPAPDPPFVGRACDFRKRARSFIDDMPNLCGFVRYFRRGGHVRTPCASSTSQSLEACSTHMFDEDEFCRPTACARCRAGIATIRSSSFRRRRERARLRAGGIDDGAVRRQFELARAGVVSAQFLAVESLTACIEFWATTSPSSCRPALETRSISAPPPTRSSAG